MEHVEGEEKREKTKERKERKRGKERVTKGGNMVRRKVI